MNLPAFLVIGAAKAGTSSLDQYLKQHPQIYLNTDWRELRFFAYDGHPPDYRGPGDRVSNLHTETDLSSYAAHFATAAGGQVVGEVSPVYLYSPRAPERIQHYTPDAKLIAILRHPVDRAYSHFLHLTRDGREPLASFDRALAAEDRRVRDHWEWSWHYRRVGLYADQLRRYFERFDRAQIRIHLYEDFDNDPVGVLRDLFRFLAVDDTFVPDVSVRHNVSGIPRRRLLATTTLAVRRHTKHILQPVQPLIPAPWWRKGATLLWRLHNWNKHKPELPPEIRARLIETYRDDILQLQALVGRDLSHWLSSS